MVHLNNEILGKIGSNFRYTMVARLIDVKQLISSRIMTYLILKIKAPAYMLIHLVNVTADPQQKRMRPLRFMECVAKTY